MSPQIKYAPALTGIAQDRIRYAKAFGACAPIYERVRSGYPASLICDIGRFAGENGIKTVLEAGAGSGKATIPIAKLGVVLDCIEPSRRMSGILRTSCAGFPNVTILTTTFERWRPRRHYCVLVAAQSWHLIDPAVRLAKAAQVIRSGGTLALFWNLPPQPASDLAGRTLDSILRDLGLDLTPASNPTTEPRTLPPLYSSPDFTDISVKTYRTTYRLPLSRYLDILRTYPEYNALGRSARQRLSDQLTSTVFARGYVDGCHYTSLHLARRT
jgi:SAM-dependent methyltransferase